MNKYIIYKKNKKNHAKSRRYEQSNTINFYTNLNATINLLFNETNFCFFVWSILANSFNLFCVLPLPNCFSSNLVINYESSSVSFNNCQLVFFSSWLAASAASEVSRLLALIGRWRRTGTKTIKAVDLLSSYVCLSKHILFTCLETSSQFISPIYLMQCLNLTLAI